MNLDQTIQQHLEKLPLPQQNEVLDFVLYLEQKNKRQISQDNEQRARLAQALEQAVAVNPYSGIDPTTWVKEQRLDRDFPGRD